MRNDLASRYTNVSLERENHNIATQKDFVLKK